MTSSRVAGRLASSDCVRAASEDTRLTCNPVQLKYVDKLLLVVATVVSVDIAYWMYLYEYQPVVADASGYYNLSRLIASKGFLDFAVQDGSLWSGLAAIRTYAYPAFLLAFDPIVGPSLERLQFLVFNVHLLMYLATSFIAARIMGEVFGSRAIVVVTFLATSLNPLLLAYSGILLTDLPSAVLCYLSITLLLGGCLSARSRSGHGLVLLAFFSAGLAAMVRPGNIVIVGALGVVWVGWQVWTRCARWRFAPLVALAVLLPFLPQMAVNYRAYGAVNPPGPGQLYAVQMIAGTQVLKYGGIIGAPIGPYVLYVNPFRPADVATPDDFWRRSPAGYVMTLVGHAVALFDQGLIFPYPATLAPWYRWPVLVVNWLFLFVAATGIWCGFCRLVRERCMERESFAMLALVIMGTALTSVYVPGEVEARYSLPVYLLLAPLFAYGARAVWWAHRQRSSVLGAWYSSLMIVVVGAVWFSAWLDAQAIVCSGWAFRIETAVGCVPAFGPP
jgi:hypothetical protein